MPRWALSMHSCNGESAHRLPYNIHFSSILWSLLEVKNSSRNKHQWLLFFIWAIDLVWLYSLSPQFGPTIINLFKKLYSAVFFLQCSFFSWDLMLKARPTFGSPSHSTRHLWGETPVAPNLIWQSHSTRCSWGESSDLAGPVCVVIRCCCGESVSSEAPGLSRVEIVHIECCCKPLGELLVAPDLVTGKGWAFCIILRPGVLLPTARSRLCRGTLCLGTKLRRSDSVGVGGVQPQQPVQHSTRGLVCWHFPIRSRMVILR